MNIAGLLVISVWTMGLCSLMFGILKLLGLLRVDRQTEILGMDVVKHGEPAYPVAAYGDDYRHLHNKQVEVKKQNETEDGNNNAAFSAGDAAV